MPVIQVHCRPKTIEQRRRALAEIATAAANALDVDPALVQVFITEYDDDHWTKGAIAARPA